MPRIDILSDKKDRCSSLTLYSRQTFQLSAKTEFTMNFHKQEEKSGGKKRVKS